MDFLGGSILEDVYYGYNNMSGDQEFPRERARKLTLTDITDEFDEVLEDNVLPEDINAEEAFQTLEEDVKEWKGRLETVMCDGLRKLRKNIKEQRLTVKYIPGVSCGKDELGILNEAKLDAIRSCEAENGKILREISRRIDRIFNLYPHKATTTNEISNIPSKLRMAKDNQNKKKLVNISCAGGGGLDNFKELLQKIGDIQEDSIFSFRGSTIPIYSPNCDQRDKYALVQKGCTEIIPAYNRWFFPESIVQTVNCLPRIPSSLQQKRPVAIDVKEDFKIKHFLPISTPPRKRTMKKHPLPKSRLTKQRLNKRYETREFVTKAGVTKIFISKRKERQESLHESEDIYSDWVRLLEKPTVKVNISTSPKPVGPFLYSEVLKRNLILPLEAPEDIYESWRDTLIAQEETSYVKREPRNTPEDFFQAWKYNLNPELWGYETHPFLHEKIFRSWRRNLFEPRRPSTDLKTTNSPSIPENYFSDWLHNFTTEKEVMPKLNRKNTRRQSRRKRSGKKEHLD